MSGVQAATAPAGRTPDSDISSRERQEILVKIDEMVAGARKPVDGADRPLRAARSGALFPLLVNLGAAALIAAGVYFLPRLFDRERADDRGTDRGGARGRGAHRQRRGPGRRGEARGEGSGDRRHPVEDRRPGPGAVQPAHGARRGDRPARAGPAQQPSPPSSPRSGSGWRSAGASAAALDKQLAALDQKRTTELEQQLAAYRKQKDAELAVKEKEIDARFAAYQRDLADGAERADLCSRQTSPRPRHRARRPSASSSASRASSRR